MAGTNSRMVREVTRVSVVTMVANIALAVFKFIAGFAANSAAMISDAVESVADLGSTMIVLIGVRIADKERDAEHPYGHERMESVAAIILSVVLMLTGIGIGADGITKIRMGIAGELVRPGMLALIAAGVSIAVKEWMYWYGRAAAKRTGSASLMADAWHHRVDGFTSIGTLIGIAGARMGLPVLDPITSLFICVMIFRVAVSIAKSAFDQMIDRSCAKDIEEEIRGIALAQEGVKGVDLLSTRMFGTKFYIDIEISADSTLSLEQAHEIATRVHDSIEARFPSAKHCMVHMNPV